MPQLELYPTFDGGDWFASTRCGDVRVIAPDPWRTRVSQVRDGVELMGWVDGPLDFVRGPFRCTLRVVWREADGRWMLSRGTTEANMVEVQTSPDGFVHADAPLDDELAPLLAKGGSVYWLVAAAPRVACKRWSFVRVRDDDGPLLVLETPIRVEESPAYASFTSHYTPDKHELTLMGPHFAPPRARPSELGSRRLPLRDGVHARRHDGRRAANVARLARPERGGVAPRRRGALVPDRRRVRARRCSRRPRAGARFRGHTAGRRTRRLLPRARALMRRAE
jgi:hypothetical protein